MWATTKFLISHGRIVLGTQAQRVGHCTALKLIPGLNWTRWNGVCRWDQWEPHIVPTCQMPQLMHLALCNCQFAKFHTFQVIHIHVNLNDKSGHFVNHNLLFCGVLPFTWQAMQSFLNPASAGPTALTSMALSSPNFILNNKTHENPSCTFNTSWAQMWKSKCDQEKTKTDQMNSFKLSCGPIWTFKMCFDEHTRIHCNNIVGKHRSQMPRQVVSFVPVQKKRETSTNQGPISLRPRQSMAIINSHVVTTLHLLGRHCC